MNKKQDKTINKLSTINTLTSIQNELNAPKNLTKPGIKYMYRSAEDIMTALKPLLKKYGAVLYITDEVKEIGEIKYMESTCHFKSGEHKATSIAQAGIDLKTSFMQIPQQFGSASSYARKYALSGLFLIDDEDSKDPDGIEPQKTNQPKPPKQTTKNETPETLKQLITSTMNHYSNAVTKKKIPEKAKQKYDEFMANIDIETDMKKIRGVRSALKKLISG